LEYQRNIIIAILSAISIFIIGVVGYSIIENDNPHGDWTLTHAIYMTVITLTTVGYSDYNMSDEGKIFTVVLVLGGIGVFLYSLSVATAFIIEGQLQKVFWNRRMEKSIDKLSNHYIVCGIGDTGVHALDELIHLNADFVAVEREQIQIEHLLETRDFLYVQGDATEDEVLMRAGIDRARGLIASLSTDQDNLFVVLSAKQLNRSLRVTSKAVEESSRAKLAKAGADDVVLADQIGGLRLVSTVIRPMVVDFLDDMLKHHVTTRFSESIIQSESPFIGLTLSEAGIPDETGLAVVAVRNRAGDYIYNPSGALRLDEGDALIVIADNTQLMNLNKLTRDTL
jgi:voltage-gated potassium channel